MAKSLSQSASKTRLLTGLLDRISDAQMETLEIVTDVTQMSQLMNSLLEAQSGQIVSFKTAFSDL